MRYAEFYRVEPDPRSGLGPFAIAQERPRSLIGY